MTSEHNRRMRLVQTLVLVILGGIGAAAGFTHTHDWAVHHGQTGWLAWADAVVIEGMAVVAGFEIYRDRATGRTPRLPVAVLVVAFVVQMTAQVALAEPTPAGWLLAAMPALGFLTVVKLVLRRSTTGPDTAPADPPQGKARHTTPMTETTVDSPRSTPGSVMRKLPAALRSTVTAVADQAHAAGRLITADDLSDVVSLPDPMLADLVHELNLPLTQQQSV